MIPFRSLETALFSFSFLHSFISVLKKIDLMSVHDHLDWGSYGGFQLGWPRFSYIPFLEPGTNHAFIGRETSQQASKRH
jgi:hypothetical protein